MKKKNYNCPGEMTISLIGGKWKVIILYNLRKKPKRFGELIRLSPGINASTLTKNLKDLEESGLISHTIIGSDKTEGVEYALTEIGFSMKPVINSLIKWGHQNKDLYLKGEFGMAIFQK